MKPAKIVDVVGLRPPLPAEFAPPVFVTTPVVDVPLVVVERAQPAPVISYVAPAPAKALAAALAPEVEDVAPTPAVTCAEQVLVAEYVAPAPVETCEAPTPVVDCIVPVPAVTLRGVGSSGRGCCSTACRVLRNAGPPWPILMLQHPLRLAQRRLL